MCGSTGSSTYDVAVAAAGDVAAAAAVAGGAVVVGDSHFHVKLY